MELDLGVKIRRLSFQAVLFVLPESFLQADYDCFLNPLLRTSLICFPDLHITECFQFLLDPRVMKLFSRGIYLKPFSLNVLYVDLPIFSAREKSLATSSRGCTAVEKLMSGEFVNEVPVLQLFCIMSIRDTSSRSFLCILDCLKSERVN